MSKNSEMLNIFDMHDGLPQSDDYYTMPTTDSGLVNTHVKMALQQRRRICDGISSLQHVKSKNFNIAVFIDVGYATTYDFEMGDARSVAAAAGFCAVKLLLPIKKLKPEWNIRICAGDRKDEIDEFIDVSLPGATRRDVEDMVGRWRDHPVFSAKNGSIRWLRR